MKIRKPIEQFDTVVFKYSKENVASHKRCPEYFPKVGTEGICVESINKTLKVKWDKFDDAKYVEEDSVLVRRKKKEEAV
jgi:hypothetical protein